MLTTTLASLDFPLTRITACTDLETFARLAFEADKTEPFVLPYETANTPRVASYISQQIYVYDALPRQRLDASRAQRSERAGAWAQGQTFTLDDAFILVR